MNPYQRIPGRQAGHIDTQAKFLQMTGGICLDGISVLDIGCNLGEMSRMAAAEGATVLGIDNRPDYIHDARRMSLGRNPRFEVGDGYRATGRYDLAILSACFHYFQDPARLLRQLARVTQRVRVDVWVHQGEGMVLSHRNSLIPCAALFLKMAGMRFGVTDLIGPALSPDKSTRLLFDLGKPMPDPWKSVIIYGAGGTGKTTRGRELKATGYEHLQLDAVFVEWNIGVSKRGWSVVNQTETMRGRTWDEYLRHARGYINRWLSPRRGLDVVIEGYEACEDSYREMVLEELAKAGWTNTEEVRT